jgi:hypothetical protein
MAGQNDHLSDLQMKGSAAGLVSGQLLTFACAPGLEYGQHLIAPSQLDCSRQADPAGDCHPNARILLRASGCCHWGWGWGTQ